MPEALARMRHDSILTAPARKASAIKDMSGRRWISLRLPKQVSSYAGAAMAAAMVGILINALVMQREHHPSPFFNGAASSVAAAAKTAPAVVATADAASNTPLPPPRPAGNDATVAHASDPIGDVLKGAGAKESQKLVVSVQTALAKLGYSVRATGTAGPETTSAIREFEKSRNLPISTEITPRLLKSLTSAANTTAAR